jgi:hypothetical protein
MQVRLMTGFLRTKNDGQMKSQPKVVARDVSQDDTVLTHAVPAPVPEGVAKLRPDLRAPKTVGGILRNAAIIAHRQVNGLPPPTTPDESI